MLLIDGYNLIFVIHQGRPDGAVIEKRRADLLHLLEQYARRATVKIQVVFDSKERIFPHGRREKRPGVEVVFTPTDRSADEVMMERMAEVRDKKSMTVVTSDREIIRCAQKHRLEFITSQDFLGRIIRDIKEDRSGGPASEYREKREGITPAEAEQWMKEFGLDKP